MLREISKVVVPNGVVLATVTLAQIELYFKIALLVASLVYTIMHCVLLWRKLRRE